MMVLVECLLKGNIVISNKMMKNRRRKLTKNVKRK